MRILLFHPWIKSKGGAEKLVLEYVKRSKHKIHILTWFYSPDRTYEEFRKYKIISIFPEIFDNISRAFLFRGAFFGIFGNLIKILKKEVIEKYDLVLISTSGIAETILLRADRTNVPIVLYVHTPLRAAYKYDIIYNIRNRYKYKPLARLYYKAGIFIYNKMEKSAWKKVDFAIFNSRLSLKRALDKGLIDEDRTKVIYPGVDINIKPGEYKDYFLYVGRFGEAKRQDVVLYAWKLFNKKYPEYKLVLAGNLENIKFYRKLHKIVEYFNLKNVIFVSNASSTMMNNLHSNALCEIQVPFMEDFGIAPLEAIVAAKPLIAVDSMGVLELIGNLPSIIKIRESIDKAELAKRLYKAMEEFVKNKDYYIDIAIENMDYIRKLNLTWKRFTEEMDQTLEYIAELYQQESLLF